MSVFDLWNPLMPTTSIRSIVWENDGGGGSGGSSGGDRRPAKAKALDKSGSNVPTFGSLAEASRAGYHGQTVNIEGKGLQNVSFGDKDYDAQMAAASNAANAANTGGIPSLINDSSARDYGFIDSLLMGFGFKDRTPEYYAGTADTLARQYGPERAQTYINEMRDKGNITTDLANALMESTTILGEDSIRRGLITDDTYIKNPIYKQMLETAGGVSSSNDGGSGSNQTDGDQIDGDQTDGDQTDGEEEDTGPPSSMDFRFFGGYQPIARSDVLVPSSFQNQDIYRPNPRLDPIFPQRPEPVYGLYDDVVSGGFDYGDGGFTPGLISGPRTVDPGMNYGGGELAQAPAEDMVKRSELLNDPNYRGDGTNFGMVMPATPGPQMPGQGQFNSMQELMEYQQQYPMANLMGEYQRLRALEGGAVQPVTLPQRGVASLFNEQAPRYMYEGIMG